ncbi:MAG TPA: DUF4345 domain-containing protein [Nevskiaceae bacterium]|nr:DUF4345 domain-containing protein [Nevskiaceae bacterium]
MADHAIQAVAVFFLGMGLVALVRPESILSFFGIPALTLDARNEVRAVYGGFGVAIAGLLVMALRDDGLRAGVLVAVAVALLGMAAGRVVSAIVDRKVGGWPAVFFCVEVGLAGLCGLGRV